MNDTCLGKNLELQLLLTPRPIQLAEMACFNHKKHCFNMKFNSNSCSGFSKTKKTLLQYPNSLRFQQR